MFEQEFGSLGPQGEERHNARVDARIREALERTGADSG